MSVYHLLTDFLGKLGAKMFFFTESIVSNKIVAICCASH